MVDKEGLVFSKFKFRTAEPKAKRPDLPHSPTPVNGTVLGKCSSIVGVKCTSIDFANEHFRSLFVCSFSGVHIHNVDI